MTYKRNRFVVLVIGLVLVAACTKRISSDLPDLPGQYINLKGSPDYTYLNLRSDSTYFAYQSVQYGDIMLHYYGQWNETNGILILYKGKDIGTNIITQKIENINSDTLLVNIDESIFERMPRVKFTIYGDTTDLEIFESKIEVIKSKHWNFDDELIDEDNYEYVPLGLNLRSGNISANIPYVFRNSEISVSLERNANIEVGSDTILCKYSFKDSILYSFHEAYEITRNSLRKAEN